MAYDATQVTTNAFAVTPSDSTIISAFGFYVGTTGDVAVMPMAQEGGNATPVTFTAVPAGQIIALVCSRIMSTNTTASNIVAFGPK